MSLHKIEPIKPLIGETEMTNQTHKEKMQEAKKIYFMEDFRAFMRKMQGLTDEDFQAPVPRIKEKILSATEKDPLEMFERIMREVESEWDRPSPLPMNSDWHHFIVPGVIVSSLRNNGYPITDREVEEAVRRGQKFAGGSCGFTGVCGGANSFGIVLSLLKKTNPLHDEARSENLRLVGEVLKEISRYPRRCCKRSSYIAIEKAVAYLRDNGFERIPVSRIVCQWSAKNRMCFGAKCPYFPKKGEH
jgi:hypothetical protein